MIDQKVQNKSKQVLNTKMQQQEERKFKAKELNKIMNQTLSDVAKCNISIIGDQVISMPEAPMQSVLADGMHSSDFTRT